VPKESGVGSRWFFRGKESGVEKTRESESGVGVGNSVNRLPSPGKNCTELLKVGVFGGSLKNQGAGFRNSVKPCL